MTRRHSSNEWCELLLAKRNRKTSAKTKNKAKEPVTSSSAPKKADNPHDKRFKELFANKKSFLSLLRDCIKDDWVNRLDGDSLIKSGKSFILQDFSELEADIVYEASLDGSKVIFYILQELQSYVDYRMQYRLLLYIVEILRDFFNNSDVNERDNKDFKFPVVFPIVFYSGSGAWTVPLSLNQMFDGYEHFGSHVLNFDYMLVDAKGFNENDLKVFSSRLLATVLMMEKSQNDVEFYDSIRKSLSDIKGFDTEEMRIFELFIKIMDLAYGKNKGREIQTILNENKIEDVDRMLCDLVENAKREKEELWANGKQEGLLEGKQEGLLEGKQEGLLEGKQEGLLEGKQEGLLEGKLEEKIDVAKAMLREKLPIDLIIRVTNLKKEDIEAITI